eukprot:365083-Chlamydomonas_euryale.AAC.39
MAYQSWCKLLRRLLGQMLVMLNENDITDNATAAAFAAAAAAAMAAAAAAAFASAAFAAAAAMAAAAAAAAAAAMAAAAAAAAMAAAAAAKLSRCCCCCCRYYMVLQLPPKTFPPSSPTRLPGPQKHACVPRKRTSARKMLVNTKSMMCSARDKLLPGSSRGVSSASSTHSARMTATMKTSNSGLNTIMRASALRNGLCGLKRNSERPKSADTVRRCMCCRIWMLAAVSCTVECARPATLRPDAAGISAPLPVRLPPPDAAAAMLLAAPAVNLTLALALPWPGPAACCQAARMLLLSTLEPWRDPIWSSNRDAPRVPGALPSSNAADGGDAARSATRRGAPSGLPRRPCPPLSLPAVSRQSVDRGVLSSTGDAEPPASPPRVRTGSSLAAPKPAHSSAALCSPLPLPLPTLLLLPLLLSAACSNDSPSGPPGSGPAGLRDTLLLSTVGSGSAAPKTRPGTVTSSMVPDAVMSAACSGGGVPSGGAGSAPPPSPAASSRLCKADKATERSSPGAGG